MRTDDIEVGGEYAASLRGVPRQHARRHLARVRVEETRALRPPRYSYMGAGTHDGIRVTILNPATGEPLPEKGEVLRPQQVGWPWTEEVERRKQIEEAQEERLARRRHAGEVLERVVAQLDALGIEANASPDRGELKLRAVPAAAQLSAVLGAAGRSNLRSVSLSAKDFNEGVTPRT